MMTFEEFSKDGTGIFADLGDIREFTMIAKLPEIPLLDDDAVSTRVLYEMYERVAEVVRVAGAHYENELELAKEPHRLVVRYADDTLQFEVHCTRDYIF